MEYYSALKKTEMSFAGKWMEPELILLSEISQTEKDKHHMLSLYAETRPEKKKKRMTSVKRRDVWGWKPVWGVECKWRG
jgi:hypothetical protein